MRIRFSLLTLAIVATACGDAAPVASESPPPASTVPAPSVPVATMKTTTAAPATTPPSDPDRESFREEWFIETNRGEITALGEHSSNADRWLEMYGPDPDSFNREVIAIGDQAWNRYSGEDWELVDADDDIVSDLLNGHPFEADEVIAEFEPGESGTYLGRAVSTYSAVGAEAAKYSGIDVATIVDAAATVSLFADNRFATYEVYFESDNGDWARLTYRSYDFGAPITIEAPEVIPPPPLTCRNRGMQLIDEVGAYRSRYDVLHPGAVFSSIVELRTLDPWAWQLTIDILGGPAIDTLWVSGGAQYWRTLDSDWQEDVNLEYLPLAYRPFVDDLWVPDLVELFTPVGQAEVAGRIVDVYELGLEDIERLNSGLVRNTDTLDATLWIEPCSSPQLVKLEVIATGSGYAEGDFHVVYELYDLGTTDVIDIPDEALGG